MGVSEHDIEQIVDRAVDRTLTKVGIFVNDPKEMQGMMHYLNQQYRGNVQFKSDLRRNIVSVLMPPFAIVLWESVKRSLNL